MRILALLISLAIILFSCKNDVEYSYSIQNNFEEPKNLKLNRTGITALQPIGLFYTDDKYLIQDQASDTVFTVIDPDSKKIDILLGVKGEGPNEFENNYIFTNNRINRDVPFLGFNSADKTFYELEFKSKNEDVIGYSLSMSPYSITSETNMIQDYAVLNGTELVITNDVREKLFLLDLSDESPSISTVIPFSKEESNILIESRKIGKTLGVLPGIISMSPDGEIVGYASRNLGYFQLFDKNLSPVSEEIYIGEGPTSRVDKYFSDLNNPSFYIIDLVLCENYIYVLFLDKSMEVASTLDPSIQSTVLVFDYNLQLIDHLNLNAFVGSILVNEDSKEIIGLDYSIERFELVYYSIKQLF